MLIGQIPRCEAEARPDIVRELESAVQLVELEALSPSRAAKAIRAAIDEINLLRSAAKGFCWSCGATPRYQHKDGCRASRFRALSQEPTES